MSVIDKIEITEDIISWTISNNRSACGYRVEINGDLTEVEDVGMVNISHLPYCVQHEIIVTPVHYNGDLGKPVSKTFERGIHIIYVTNTCIPKISSTIFFLDIPQIEGFYMIQAERRQDGIRAHWTSTENSAQCTVLIQYDGDSIEYPASKGEEGILFNHDEFQQCKEHTLNATYVSESNKMGPESNYIFRKSKL